MRRLQCWGVEWPCLGAFSRLAIAPYPAAAPATGGNAASRPAISCAAMAQGRAWRRGAPTCRRILPPGRPLPRLPAGPARLRALRGQPFNLCGGGATSETSSALEHRSPQPTQRCTPAPAPKLPAPRAGTSPAPMDSFTAQCAKAPGERQGGSTGPCTPSRADKPRAPWLWGSSRRWPRPGRDRGRLPAAPGPPCRPARPPTCLPSPSPPRAVVVETAKQDPRFSQTNMTKVRLRQGARWPPDATAACRAGVLQRRADGGAALRCSLSLL